MFSRDLLPRPEGRYAWFITYAIFVPIAWVLTNLFDLLFGWLGGDSEPAEIQLPEPPIDGEEGQGWRVRQ